MRDFLWKIYPVSWQVKKKSSDILHREEKVKHINAYAKKKGRASEISLLDYLWFASPKMKQQEDKDFLENLTIYINMVLIS